MPPASIEYTQVVSTNDTHVLNVPSNNLLMVNGTLIQILLKKPFRDSEINELLYVIIVIVFYATALMTLIITQIKRQRREGMDVDYYDEYLQRNQEVKRTCQTATTIVLKTDPKNPGAGTNSGAGGDSGAAVTLLPPPSRSPRDLSPKGGGRYAFGRGAGGEDGNRSPGISPRETSPMLESIPDNGT